MEIIKYPRTYHIEGSRFQNGDEDLNSVPFEQIKGKFLVIEEKIDGANAGISFSENGELLLQSRGHYLTGGLREKHFALLKTWANTFAYPMFEAIGDQYIMYGEWLYAKHTVFYTDLPHYFFEFDMYDKSTKTFLSTAERGKILAKMPFVQSVKVIFEGKLEHQKQLQGMVKQSHFIGENHLKVLKQLCNKLNLNAERVLKETNSSNLMEGLYIKWEENGIVKGRYKFVRPDFLNSILDSETHWLDRPIVPNQLAEGVDLFSF
jgi:hypothetical protein